MKQYDNDDLISRQSLRQAMYHEAFEKDSDEQKWDSGCWIRYKMFERVIDAQPSAQPEITLEQAIDRLNELGWLQEHDRILTKSAQPKKGRWIKDRLPSLNGGDYEVFRCSECESAFNWRMRYCGHCGAKMKRRTDENRETEAV